jgi:hypothetical protein
MSTIQAQIDPTSQECTKLQENGCDDLTHDVLFIVDASNSMDPNRFYAEMLDFTELLYCGFNAAPPNQAGLILFNDQVQVVIPLANYGRDSWFNQIEGVRNEQNSAITPCCRCCSPHAEAFELAGNEFDLHGKKKNQKTAILISDGTPHQNLNGPYRWPTMSYGYYNFHVVPDSANALKAKGVRIILVGVPNGNGRPPETDYFAGIPNPNKVPDGGSKNEQCLKRNPETRVVECDTMVSPPFPIVTTPVKKNIVWTEDWNILILSSKTLNTVCGFIGGAGEPTMTKFPTQFPTLKPTKEPVAPTRKGTPTNKPSKKSGTTTSVPTTSTSVIDTEAPTVLTLNPTSPTKPTKSQPSNNPTTVINTTTKPTTQPSVKTTLTTPTNDNTMVPTVPTVKGKTSFPTKSTGSSTTPTTPPSTNTPTNPVVSSPTVKNGKTSFPTTTSKPTIPITNAPSPTKPSVTKTSVPTVPSIPLTDAPTKKNSTPFPTTPPTIMPVANVPPTTTKTVKPTTQRPVKPTTSAPTVPTVKGKTAFPTHKNTTPKPTHGQTNPTLQPTSGTTTAPNVIVGPTTPSVPSTGRPGKTAFPTNKNATPKPTKNNGITPTIGSNTKAPTSAGKPTTPFPTVPTSDTTDIPTMKNSTPFPTPPVIAPSSVTKTPTTATKTIKPTHGSVTSPAPTITPTAVPTSPTSKGKTAFPTNKNATPKPTTQQQQPTTSSSSSFPTRKNTTPFPSIQPTIMPTTPTKPTTQPVGGSGEPAMDQLDLLLLVDHSRSMRWDSEFCKNAPGADPNVPPHFQCWRLIMGFVKNLGNRMANLDNPNLLNIGWAGEQSDPTKGLTVTVLGFACANNQQTPLVFQIGDGLDTEATFLAAVEYASTHLAPDGGTCPGEAIDRMVLHVQNSLMRPFKAALLLTDGIYYDQPRPEDATKGLEYFNVIRFALGIAIPYPKNPDGLTPSERANQIKQLITFVGGHEDQLYDFDEEGYNLLDTVVDQIASLLPTIWQHRTQEFQANPFYCGYTTKELCVRRGDTANFCKWNGKRCKYKPRCDKPKKMCGKYSIIFQPDLCCQWNENSNVCEAIDPLNIPDGCVVE